MFLTTRPSGPTLDLGEWAHRSSSFLLSSSPSSPSETDVESEAERALILWTNGSIACLFTSVR